MRGWRRRRALKKVRPGDGSALAPYRPWHLLYRSLFFAEIVDPTGESHVYAVDVDLFDIDSTAHLYRDGCQEASATTPATFPVPGGVIEVATTMFGLKRIHVVPDDGPERQMLPHRRSGEGWRARVAQRFPRTSRAIGIAAVVVLVISLCVAVPQTIERITQIPLVADAVGTFTMPFSVPSAVNTALLVGAVCAGIERALMLRYHWLVDGEAWWMG